MPRRKLRRLHRWQKPQARPVRNGKRYVRAFLLWLARRGRQLPVRLKLQLRFNGTLLFGLEGYPEAIFVSVGPQRVQRYVAWDGPLIDYFADLESAAHYSGRRFYCAECKAYPEGIHHGQRWPSAEALWIEHDFEALADWLEETVAPAHWLYLVGRPRGPSWAEFSQEPRTFDAKYTVHSWRLPAAGAGLDYFERRGQTVPLSA